MRLVFYSGVSGCAVVAAADVGARSDGAIGAAAAVGGVGGGPWRARQGGVLSQLCQGKEVVQKRVLCRRGLRW